MNYSDNKRPFRRSMFIHKHVYAISYSALMCTILLLGLAISGLSAACNRTRAIETANIRVQFVNSRVGWIIGPRLLQTKDGGRTWEVIRQNGNGTVYSQLLYIERQLVQFIDPEVGYMMSYNGILQTNDGGRTWSGPFPLSPKNPDARALSIFFISTTEGWAISGDVFHTSDGGRNWERLAQSPIKDLQPAFCFIDREKGLITSTDGDIYLTKNGGKNWESVWKTDKPIYNIFFIDKQNGWVVGGEGLLALTSDGGQTWTLVQTPTTSFLTSVFFIDKQTGWVVGHNGVILLTKNGGATWTQASIAGLGAAPPPLTSVSFADDKHGVAVGGNGTESFSSTPSNIILTTTDGGQTWHVIKP